MHAFLLCIGQAGLEIKYHVDPAHMRSGENSAFLSYLATHMLQVDVWDGDSLMLVGSVSIPLKVGDLHHANTSVEQ